MWDLGMFLKIVIHWNPSYSMGNFGILTVDGNGPIRGKNPDD